MIIPTEYMPSALFIFLALAGLGAFVALIIDLNQGICFHRFRTGFGLMGDAWRCEKCGLDKYPEALEFKATYRALGRVEDD